MAALAADHRVIALDLPGFAGSSFIDGGLEAVADRVADAARALRCELAEKPILLGNGYGGFVALLTAIRHPALAERLVLADCGAAFNEPGRAAFRGMSAAASQKRSRGDRRRRDATAVRARLPGRASGPDRRAQGTLPGDRPDHLPCACAALASLDLRPQLAAVQLPVLVLVGEFDEATPPPMARELAAGLPLASCRCCPVARTCRNCRRRPSSWQRLSFLGSARAQPAAAA